jgi:putative membrane protein
MLPNYLQALPQFLFYLGAGILLLALFWSLYTYLTPHDEIGLIRAGNNSAALLLVGALLGFLIPLAKAIGMHTTVMALAQWALVALLVQLAVYVLLRLLWRGLHEDILADRVPVALLCGFLSVAAGVLNAAAMA